MMSEDIKKARELKYNEVIACEFCGASIKRGEISKHNRSVHKYNIWKKKHGPINDPSMFL